MKIRTLLLAVFALTLLGACVKAPEIPPAPQLDLQLPVAGTQEVWNSADYKGSPVLVSVMATYCPWCKRSLPALDAATEAFKDKGVEVVGIFVDQDEATVQNVKKEHNMKSKALYQGGPAAQQLQVQGFPHMVLFDKNHRVVRVWSGYSDTLADQYKEEINKLLK